ncbi:MAG: tetratricopeptide repeat protein, partial [Pseudomonadota bacterium]
MLRRYLILANDKGWMSWLSARALALVLCCASSTSIAHAFDSQASTAVPPNAERFSAPVEAPAKALSGPGAKIRSFFKFGFTAYKDGKKEEAFDFYSKSAEEGHIGARWALANMYAAGDGVPEDDYEAFKIFRGIANEGADRGSRESSYVSGALVALGSYLQFGIPQSPVKSDPIMAREIYWQAAINYGDPHAQYMLGKMFLSGEAGAVDRRQAARWFNSSAKKGHAGARAMLGQMMFDAGKTVEGIGMMTAALQLAHPNDA